MSRSVLWCALALVLAPVALVGQSVEPRGLEAWVGYAAWSGEDVESVDPGIRGGLAFLAETAPHVGFGGEVVLGSYDQLGQSISELGLYALLRLSLGPPSGFHTFAQGRIGWNRVSAGSLSQSGLSVGPELGVEIPLSARLRLVAAGGGTWNSYENAELGSGFGFGIEGTSASGFQYGGRIGLSIGEIF